ncbi:transcription elongation protein SprT [Shivajiella indica]|uniref:Transcription elongation protein SprT n=1 Tax=Shivajiella indica TaxID=872115 RepID=A0ABW5B2Y2_9BACT
MNQDEKFLLAFRKYLPEEAVAYCFQLWKEKPFNFFITKGRLTKLGDFRYRRDRKLQTISINHNLNPFQFLITYIHEVAHYRAFEEHGLSIKPHGEEWKNTFRKLMIPVMSEKVFPKDILVALVRHFKNPKASTGADLFLSKVLKAYDKNVLDEKSLLVDLPKGEIFELQGRKFQKEHIRRTRILCAELETGRKYLISAHAEVKRVHQSES